MIKVPTVEITWASTSGRPLFDAFNRMMNPMLAAARSCPVATGTIRLVKDAKRFPNRKVRAAPPPAASASV